MAADTRYMGFNWKSARDTDPYYINAAKEQKIIDEEHEMTPATSKPRAGEHTKGPWETDVARIEAERDALRAQNSDLAKALEVCDKAIRGVIGDGPVRGNGTPYPVWADMISAAVEARALLAKHGR